MVSFGFVWFGFGLVLGSYTLTTTRGADAEEYMDHLTDLEERQLAAQELESEERGREAEEADQAYELAEQVGWGR